MIVRMDVVTCDAAEPFTGRDGVTRVGQCSRFWPCRQGVKHAVPIALARGWAQIRDAAGRRRHLCPDHASHSHRGGVPLVHVAPLPPREAP